MTHGSTPCLSVIEGILIVFGTSSVGLITYAFVFAHCVNHPYAYWKRFISRQKLASVSGVVAKRYESSVASTIVTWSCMLSSGVCGSPDWYDFDFRTNVPGSFLAKSSR